MELTAKVINKDNKIIKIIENKESKQEFINNLLGNGYKIISIKNTNRLISSLFNKNRFDKNLFFL